MINEIIKLKDVTKIYDNSTRALNNLTITINQGDWTTIMGPSGCGKTTLLNIIGCLDSFTKGSLSINGTKLTELNQNQRTRFRRDNIGLIFQQYHLVPYLSSLSYSP